MSAVDTVIRHLFSLGLQLSAMEGLTDDPELRLRIDAAIEEADVAITELRRVIFNASDTDQPDT
jgi:hypothetical protein